MTWPGLSDVSSDHDGSYNWLSFTASTVIDASAPVFIFDRYRLEQFTHSAIINNGDTIKNMVHYGASWGISVKPRCDGTSCSIRTSLFVWSFLWDPGWKYGMIDVATNGSSKDFRHLSLPCRTHRSRPAVDWQEEVGPRTNRSWAVLHHQTCRMKKKKSVKTWRYVWLYIIPTSNNGMKPEGRSALPSPWGISWNFHEGRIFISWNLHPMWPNTYVQAARCSSWAGIWKRGLTGEVTTPILSQIGDMQNNAPHSHFSMVYISHAGPKSLWLNPVCQIADD
jgi:hypothetical protein